MPLSEAMQTVTTPDRLKFDRFKGYCVLHLSTVEWKAAVSECNLRLKSAYVDRFYILRHENEVKSWKTYKIRFLSSTFGSGHTRERANKTKEENNWNVRIVIKKNLTNRKAINNFIGFSRIFCWPCSLGVTSHINTLWLSTFSAGVAGEDFSQKHICGRHPGERRKCNWK